jgi:hypothetical protein
MGFMMMIENWIFEQFKVLILEKLPSSFQKSFQKRRIEVRDLKSYKKKGPDQ